jgi:hypothetical protein
MNLSHLFSRHPVNAAQHLVGHIADVPQIVGQNGAPRRTMIFHLAEAPTVEFRLTMLPTTPARRMDDRVEVTWIAGPNGTAAVQTMYSAPDDGEIRRRNAEYLQRILDNTPK